MPKNRDELRSEVDVFLAAEVAPDGPRHEMLRTARIGWARPSVLTLAEVQELCRALVLLEADTGIVSKSAA